jgi:hypothetical protein
MRLSRLLSMVVAVLAATLLLAPQAYALPAWPNVAQGASGPTVTTVQYLLRHHSQNVTADGAFGSATRSAVVSFQSAHGLTADGSVGPQTWPVLVVAVRQGSAGEAVRAAQTQLNRHGASLAVDGQFGQGTDRAVRDFQAAHGLAADGVIGTQTWQTLVGSAVGNPGGYALPLARAAAGRSDYAASHWNSTPAVDLMVSYVPAYALTATVADHYDSTSCGTGLRLLRPDGSRFVYCHLSARTVADGASVTAGTRVGTTGNTGNSGAPHLHIEIRTPDGTAHCPQQLLLAIYDGTTPPNLSSLPTTGCTG